MKLPTYFLGHGSPMNALEDNIYSQGWQDLGRQILEREVPRALVCFSAHWQTRGFYVTNSPKPPTIYDFGGFPPELSQVKYDCPGSPEIAAELANTAGAQLTDSWGLDHGTWSILVHMFKEANIPVLQMSLDLDANAKDYFEQGKKLAGLREKGIFFFGSGNIVHNLARANFFDANTQEDWAIRFDKTIIEAIEQNDLELLLDYGGDTQDSRLATNSREHFKPLFFILGLKADDERPKIFHDGVINAALSMTSFGWGL